MPEQKPGDAAPAARKKPKVPKKGSHIRRKPYYLLRIDDETAFRLRRVDLFGLFMEGALPMPLFAAVERIQKTRKDMDSEEALASITSEDRGTMLETIRRVAVCAVKDPQMTHSKKIAIEQDLVWVGGVTDVPGEDPRDTHNNQGDVPPSILMHIYRAVNGEAGLVVLEDDEAEEFRASESRVAVTPVGDESIVPSAAVHVDLHAGDDASPGTVPASGPPTEPQREWKHYH